MVWVFSTRPRTWDVRLLVPGALLALGLAAANVTPAAAAEVRQGDAVTVGPSETIDDDLYAFGNTVVIQGTVNGTVVAAGSNVMVSGAVNGDLFAAGNSVDVTGSVRNSVRAAGSSVQLAGAVGRDALLAGSTLSVAPTAPIAQDLLLGGAMATVGAPVGRNVFGSTSQLTLAAPVHGNVTGQFEDLRLQPGAVINGNLTYTSNRDVQVAPGAAVQGVAQRTPTPAATEPQRDFAPDALGWIRGLVGVAVLGLLLVLVFPAAARTSAETIGRAMWPSLGIGFATLLAVPVAALLVFGLGLVVGGWWLSLLLLEMYAIKLAVGIVVGGLFVGEWLLARAKVPALHPAWALLGGVFVLAVVGLIPVLGPLVNVVVLAVGLGAVVIAAFGARGKWGEAAALQAPRPTPIGSAPIAA